MFAANKCERLSIQVVFCVGIRTENPPVTNRPLFLILPIKLTCLQVSYRKYLPMCPRVRDVKLLSIYLLLSLALLVRYFCLSESMQCSYARYTELKLSDWLKIVMGLGASNQSSTFWQSQSKICLRHQLPVSVTRLGNF